MSTETQARSVSQLSDEEAIDYFGIQTELRTIYIYGRYRYDNLADAISYAKENPPTKPSSDV